jgi:uncharacterized membrane protein
MSIGAAEKAAGVTTADELPEKRVEEIKAADAAAENYGNFYGQNLSPVQSGILLVAGVLAGLGHQAGVWSLVMYAIPITAISVILGIIQFTLLDRRHRKEQSVSK